MADATRTKRVLLNLVTNACKHLASKVGGSSSALIGSDKFDIGDTKQTQQGQVLIHVRLVLGDDGGNDFFANGTPKQWLRFEVHDNGDGVPTDLRSQLFVGAFVAAPWSGKCDAPPTADPRRVATLSWYLM